MRHGGRRPYNPSCNSSFLCITLSFLSLGPSPSSPFETSKTCTLKYISLIDSNFGVFEKNHKFLESNPIIRVTVFQRGYIIFIRFYPIIFINAIGISTFFIVYFTIVYRVYNFYVGFLFCYLFISGTNGKLILLRILLRFLLIDWLLVCIMRTCT